MQDFQQNGLFNKMAKRYTTLRDMLCLPAARLFSPVFPLLSLVIVTLFLILSASPTHASKLSQPYLTEEFTVEGQLFMRDHDPDDFYYCGASFCTWPIVAGANTYAVFDATNWSATYAHLLDQDGSLKKPMIGVSPIMNSQFNIDVTFIGDHYLCLFQPISYYHYLQYVGATYLTEEGEVIHPEGVVLLEPAPGVSLIRAVTSSIGDRGILAWIWTEEGSDLPVHLSFSLMDEYGSLDGSEGTEITNFSPDDVHPGFDIIAGSESYLLLWETSLGTDNPEIHAQLISMDGSLIGSELVFLGNSSQGTFDGSNYLIAWKDNTDSIFGQRIDTDGALVDQEPFFLHSAIPYDIATSPGEFAMLGGDAYSHWACFWNSSFSPVNDFYIPDYYGYSVYSIDPGYTSITSRGDGTYFGAWTVLDAHYGANYAAGNSAEGALLDHNGVLSEVIPLSLKEAEVYPDGPVVAFNGENYLVAWPLLVDNNPVLGYTFDIMGALISPEGVILEPGTFPIVQNAFNGLGSYYQILLHAASGAGNFVVLWGLHNSFDAHTIKGTFISASGEVTYPDGVQLVETVWGDPSITWDGANYFFHYTEPRADRLVVVLLSPDMEILSQTPLPRRSVGPVDAACQPEMCLVTWGGGDLSPVEGVRIGHDNTLLDSPPRTYELDMLTTHELSSTQLGDNAFVLVASYVLEPAFLLGIDKDGNPFPEEGVLIPALFDDKKDNQYTVLGVKVAELRDQILTLIWGYWDPRGDSLSTAFRATKDLKPLDQERIELWASQDDDYLDMVAGPGNQALIAYINSQKQLGLRFYTSCKPGTACDDGDLCTEEDVCDPYGVCGGTPLPECRDGGLFDVGYYDAPSNIDHDILVDQALDTREDLLPDGVLEPDIPLDAINDYGRADGSPDQGVTLDRAQRELPHPADVAMDSQTDGERLDEGLDILILHDASGLDAYPPASDEGARADHGGAAGQDRKTTDKRPLNGDFPVLPQDQGSKADRAVAFDLPGPDQDRGAQPLDKGISDGYAITKDISRRYLDHGQLNDQPAPDLADGMSLHPDTSPVASGCECNLLY